MIRYNIWTCWEINALYIQLEKMNHHGKGIIFRTTAKNL